VGTDGIGKHVRRIAVLLLLAVNGPRPLVQGADPGQQRLVGTPVTGVLVDVIVRDRQGAVVSDLDAAGVEVLEDGVRQTITLFEAPRGRRASAANVDGGKAAAPPAFSAAIAVPRLIALVFHELGPEARAAAEKAARVYLEEQKGSDEFVGVFTVDRALHTLVPYTRDLGAVERGVRTAIMRPGCPVTFDGDIPGADSDSAPKCSDGIALRR
jgi:VWFA-related protein